MGSKFDSILGGVLGVSNALKYVVLALKIYLLYFYAENRTTWNRIQKEWKLKVLIFGTGINVTVWALSLTLCAAVIGVILDLDHLKYILEILFPVGILAKFPAITILMRFVLLFLFIYGVGQNAGFLFFYCLLTFHAYLFSLKTIISGYTVPLKIIREYKILRLLHSRISPYANRINELLMFLGHTTCVRLFWLSIRGWDSLPLFLNILFPWGAIVILFWVLLILKTLSCIQEYATEDLIELKLKTFKYIGGPTFKALRKELITLHPIAFKSGEWFMISRDSPGEFLNTVMDNLTSAVITF